MIRDILIKQFKKHFFILYQEKYKNDVSNISLERFVAKHPLLKPELIVVNDEVHGFKQLGKNVLSLENYPIYFEVEYVDDEDGDRYVDSVDLYAEAAIKSPENMKEVFHLSNEYQKTVTFERVKRISDPKVESILMYSKLSSQFSEGYLDEDLKEGIVSKEELELLVEVHMVSLVNAIKILDDVLVKGKSVAQSKLKNLGQKTDFDF
ncbi:hypothetical protein HOG98_03295 [bacterium]|jgi:hypothetical protein|nr:hypothetical protein [bacterium]